MNQNWAESAQDADIKFPYTEASGCNESVLTAKLFVRVRKFDITGFFNEVYFKNHPLKPAIH